MSLDAAIQGIELEIEQLQARKPQAGTTAWWQLRAKSMGLSFLKTLKAKGINDPIVAEDYRKSTRAALALVDDES